MFCPVTEEFSSEIKEEINENRTQLKKSKSNIFSAPVLLLKINSTTIFKSDNNKWFWVSNQHIRMVSEQSRDTKN